MRIAQGAGKAVRCGMASCRIFSFMVSLRFCGFTVALSSLVPYVYTAHLREQTADVVRD